VRTFRKHVGDRLVGLLHEIVDNHQRRFFTVKVLDIRETLVKLCVGILVKALLVFSVEVNSFAGGGDISDDALSISLTRNESFHSTWDRPRQR